MTRKINGKLFAAGASVEALALFFFFVLVGRFEPGSREEKITNSVLYSVMALGGGLMMASLYPTVQSYFFSRKNAAQAQRLSTSQNPYGTFSDDGKHDGELAHAAGSEDVTKSV